MNQPFTPHSGDAHRIDKEPWYLPLGDEVQVFEAAYAQRLPVLLKGPTGCGKTRFVEHMAWRLGRPLVTVACHDDLTAADLVGRKIARDRGVALTELIADIAGVQRELAATKGEDFAVMASLLAQGLDAVRTCGLHVVANFADKPALVLSGSVPLLELLGRVCGGWQMGRAALAARQCLDRGEGERRFLRAKIVTARFYADQVLATAAGLAHAACAGSAAALVLEEDQF